jgi:hypothetical protein
MPSCHRRTATPNNARVSTHFLFSYCLCRCLSVPKPDQKRILETIVSELLGVRARAVCAVGENLRVTGAENIEAASSVWWFEG